MIFLDFETRSRADLRKVGSGNYFDHPSTELLSLVVDHKGEWLIWIPETEKLPPGLPAGALVCGAGESDTAQEWLRDAVASGDTLVAHNAYGFDELAWCAFGLPSAPHSQWLDTLPYARAAGLPGGLDEAAAALGIGTKASAGAKLLKKYIAPTRKGEWLPLDTAPFAAVVRYNLQDVWLLSRLYAALDQRINIARYVDADALAVDTRINRRGVPFDTELLTAVADIDKYWTTALIDRVTRLTAGAVSKPTLRSQPQLLAWLQQHGVDAEDVQRETLDLIAMDSSPLVRDVINARLAVSRITGPKLLAAAESLDPDDRLRRTLVYHSAHTGRWAGRRFQPQNLRRAPAGFPHAEAIEAVLLGDTDALEQIADDLDVAMSDVFGALVRSCVQAPAGRTFVSADFAAVEARGLAWIADETELLESFRNGADVYLDLAARIFHVPREQMTKDSHKDERQIGKVAVLAAGYGLGGEAFDAYLLRAGIELPPGLRAEEIIETYRDAYPAIAGRNTGKKWEGHTIRKGGLWRDLSEGVMDVICQRNGFILGRCEWNMPYDDLLCILPSGRVITYRNARIEQRVPRWGPPVRDTIVYDAPRQAGASTYGGKLAENITQAICRDLLAHALVEIDREGGEIVLHVHDSVLLECDEADAEHWAERVEAIMSTPPDWAAGFPLAAEVSIGDRFA